MSVLHDIYVLLYGCLVLTVFGCCILFVVTSVLSIVCRMAQKRRGTVFGKRPPLELKEREKRLYHAWVETDRWDEILEREREHEEKKP